MAKRFMLQQRIATSVGNAIGRQYHRQIRVRYRYIATVFTMNNRDQGSPITLPGNSPVTQAPRGGLLAAPAFGQGINDCLGRMLHRETVIGSRIDQVTFPAAVAIRPDGRVIGQPSNAMTGRTGKPV